MVQVVTLGCRLNTAESDVMKALAKEGGLENAIIVNTCAVTKEAERQAKQTIRRLRKENKNAYIVATGCAVQLQPQLFAGMPEIDRVLGNDHKMRPESFKTDLEGRVHVGALPKTIDEIFPKVMLEGKAKAFVQVQNGCNHFCSFCTIVLARGRSRSVPLASLLPHIADLLDQGAKEIILTGVDLTSYSHGGLGLGGLVKFLLEAFPSLERLRLSSLDSIEVDDMLFKLLVEEERLLPHVHLSLQSGNNTILKRMKRRHTREQSLELCQRLSQQRPEMALGADFITGFPGETEAMFQETLDLVLQTNLAHLHTFPFSGRPGTLAHTMEGQVEGSLIKERAARLRDLGQKKLDQWLGKKVGQTLRVLAEQTNRGHSDDFSLVEITSPVVPGSLVRVSIHQAINGRLIGTV